MATPSRTQEDLDLETFNHNVEAAIDAAEDIVMGSLDVSHLLMYMGHIGNKKVRRLQRMEREKGTEEASRALIEEIRNSDSPDRWKLFISALKEMSGEDSIVLQCLQSGNPDPWLDNPVHRKLIDLFRTPLAEVDIDNLRPKLIQMDLISNQQERLILAKLKQGEKAHAQVELIFAMQSHKVNWYRKFLMLLYEDDNTRRIAEQIDPDFCKEKLEEATTKKREEEEAKRLRQKQAGQSFVLTGEAGPDSAGGSRRSSGPGDGSAGSSHGDPSHDDHSMDVDPQQRDEVSCGCGCCALLRQEVAALKSEMAAQTTELMQIKKFLAQMVSKGSR